jgi:hypothetical protein
LKENGDEVRCGVLRRGSPKVSRMWNKNRKSDGKVFISFHCFLSLAAEWLGERKLHLRRKFIYEVVQRSMQQGHTLFELWRGSCTEIYAETNARTPLNSALPSENQGVSKEDAMREFASSV